MKRIGVIIPAITDFLQNELLDGIFKTASSAGFDIIVLTTATNGLEFHVQSEIMNGEESIYSLLESADFDGILFVSQYFIKESVRCMISEKIKKISVPCIDLGGESLGFETVSIPQDKIMHELTNHIIEKHNCKNLIFLAGYKDNPDSEQRMSGFLRAVDEHDCRYEIVYGDFWKYHAEKLGEEFLNHERTLPDAVVCANDIMAVTLCNTLKKGGISVPEDILVTGYDGHLFALSNFPPITTVSGSMYTLGKIGTQKLIEKLGGKIIKKPDIGIHILYGTSCGCVERNKGCQEAAQLVQDYIRHESEAGEMLEMRINSDFITKASDVDSLSELTELIDGTAHYLKGYQSMHWCLYPDWDSNPENPDICRTKPYPEEMLCILSKEAQKDGKKPELFKTSEIVPLLAQHHKPLIMFILPLHASSQVFGYCGFAYKNASDFTVSIMLFNLMSAVANGLRMLRRKYYTEYLQKKIEEASLYDKMTNLLSKKGLLLYLEKHEQESVRNGIMLITIARLLAVQNIKNNNRLSDNVIQSELLLANAIQLISGQKFQAARLDKKTFAIIYPLSENNTPKNFAEEIMVQLDILIKKMQEGSDVAFIPEPCYVCGNITAPFEKCLLELWETLNENIPKENRFAGISQLRKLRREIHKAPELNWNLKELAKYLNISKSYVQKLYKESFGISYIDDLIEARIGMAKQLLKTTDMRINEIAVSCGYQNPTHFMRQFRNKTGMSPSQFRNMQ
ncbi:MAG: helix-turn-helix domain-containing protein [Ruminococcus sp.]|nr:helix-turn-helix domain-containing protein [Ruminococcus sp.]